MTLLCVAMIPADVAVAALGPDLHTSDVPPPPVSWNRCFCISSISWNGMNVGGGGSARLRSITFVTGVPRSVREELIDLS